MSTITEYTELEQGTEEWLTVRRGIVTASVVGRLITTETPETIEYRCGECDAEANEPCVSLRNGQPIKTLHPLRHRTARDRADQDTRLTVADNDTARGLIAELTAERITGFTDAAYVTADMWRGVEDEPFAREVYSTQIAPVTEVGFMVRDFGDYRIGYSPDGLVGDDGLIEIKSRKPKRHLNDVLNGTPPAENMAQLQAGLLVSGRDWIDYVSFCGGMHLWPVRVHADPAWFDAIHAAVKNFEAVSAEITARYTAAVEGLPMTERRLDVIDTLTF